ncbi:MAG TPA: flagellar export chaperone FlgN [Deltaproteobacteria bacterium]|nr:flagellar export chaperone FlgN [Deltaproteobacteria bacterium]
MTCTELVEQYEQERDLLTSLIGHLKGELESIAADDVLSLEQSLPHKLRILRGIRELRERAVVLEDQPDDACATRLRSLQQDLVRLWNEARGLNDIAKHLVVQRLSGIDDALQAVFEGLKAGYSRDGRKAGIPLHTVRTGA